MLSYKKWNFKQFVKICEGLSYFNGDMSTNGDPDMAEDEDMSEDLQQVPPPGSKQYTLRNGIKNK